MVHVIEERLQVYGNQSMFFSLNLRFVSEFHGIPSSLNLVLTDSLTTFIHVKCLKCRFCDRKQIIGQLCHQGLMRYLFQEMLMR